MKSKKTEKELEEHVRIATSKISSYLKKLMKTHPKKAELISYWVHDFIRMTNFEDIFKPTKNKRYKKGDIIKVHLGFNIGSEEGGLHYAVVLEKNNSQSSPVITIAPLTSISSSDNPKKGKRNGEINLGDELFLVLARKCEGEIDKLNKSIEEAQKSEPKKRKKIMKTLNSNKLDIEKTLNEIKKMKNGSICLINQITTVSKIRIYDPKKSGDVLHGIRFSNKTLDLIDENIKKFFLKNWQL